VLAIAAAVLFLAERSFNRVGAQDQQAPAASGQQSQPATQQGMFKPNPTVLVITDSIGGGVSPDIKRYPDVLADKMNWNLVIDAVGARGFLPNDLTSIGINRIVAPFKDGLQFDIDHYKADYIILDGGRNDLGHDPQQFAAAYDEYLTALRTAYPNAKIVCLVPAYLNAQPAQLYPMAAESVRRSAEKNGAYVLDPIAEGWYEVDMAPLLWTDGIHPNAQGAEYYAKRVIDDMVRLGVIPNAEPAPGAK
jgi:lysophospholipase L1-like esterase